MRKHRLKQITFLDGIALGAFLATEVFLFTFWILDLLPKGSDPWVGFLGNMIVASFSIVAAFIALRGNRIQVIQTNDIEDERRDNALIAARAMLPAILSEMANVARNNLMLRFQAGHAPTGFNVPHPTTFQRLPETIIPNLKHCIENADKVSQDRLANILRHFQVQQVRETEAGIGLIAPGTQQLDTDILNAISDAIGWAVVYGLIGDSFAYARGTQDSIPSVLNPNQARHAFVFAGVTVPSYPTLDQILESRILENRLERQWNV